MISKNLLIHPHHRAFIATSLRHSGASSAPYDQFNLALHVGDNPKDVEKNRDKFVDMLPDALYQPVFTYQSHSTHYEMVDALHAGKGRYTFEDGVIADALVTQTLKLPLAIYHADCVPVVLVHLHQPLLILIHAGQPGTLERITYNVLTDVCATYHVKAEDFEAYLGPSIDFEHVTMTESSWESLVKDKPFIAQGSKRIAGRVHLDLPLLNVLQLRECGVLNEHIKVSDADTYSDKKRFFSAARESKTGRHCTICYLR
jgi:YfiH family protein